MIAVEWQHEFGSGNASIRTGILLSTGMGKDQSNRWPQSETIPCAFIITRRLDGDPYVRGHPRPVGDYPNILMTIDIKKLIVKGVNIPFEPYGAEK